MAPTPADAKALARSVCDDVPAPMALSDIDLEQGTGCASTCLTCRRVGSDPPIAISAPEPALERVMAAPPIVDSLEFHTA